MIDLEIIKISNINDNRIENYKSMRDNLVDKSGSKLFVAEGEKVVLKLLKSNLQVLSILARSDFYEEHAELLSSHTNSEYFTADDVLLKEIIGFKMHTGVMALAFKPINYSQNNLSNKVVVLNNIVDSENVGSILRNCAAFGFDSLIVDKSTSSPFMRRAVRVSMATVFVTNIYYSDNIIEDLIKLKKAGYTIFSAEVNKDSISINSINFPEKFVIIFGNEANGISRQILDISDNIIHIPMTNIIESLNVASSSAIILSTIFNQNKC